MLRQFVAAIVAAIVAVIADAASSLVMTLPGCTLCRPWHARITTNADVAGQASKRSALKELRHLSEQPGHCQA